MWVIVVLLSILSLMVGACIKAPSVSSATSPAAVTPGTTLVTTSTPAPISSPLPNLSSVANVGVKLPYTIVDTGQAECYNNSREITCSQAGEAFYGQDAQYQGSQPAYQDNRDGTVTDLNTGLMWQKSMKKVVWKDAALDAARDETGGYTDWRVPTIKELYSLINFNGDTGTARPESPSAPADAIPYIDTKYFNFEYGTTGRYIDAQYLTSTEYVSTTMNGNATIFGVNFADGRIKGYPKSGNPHTGMFYARYVRGNISYGANQLVDNGDNTVTDKATGLMWSKTDSGSGMNWQEALAWVQARNAANYLGHNDWRLPNVKELHSIVDYTRAPDVTGSAAIDPIFNITSITNEGGKTDYPYFWTGTTHLDNNGAVYIAFGRALGYMEMPPNSGRYQLLDVHGAGAQRSDPKRGDASAYPHGLGPQGDVIRINNFVRLVRDAR
jgi:hypothetical protein